MQIKGSEENQRFLEYQHMRRDLNIRLDSAKNAMSDDDFKQFRKDMGKMLDSLNSNFLEKNPDHILSVIMKATKEIDVPIVDSLGDTLSEQQRYVYYATHYFDNMSVDNEAVLRTPPYVFYDRVERYFDQVVNGASPETICKYTDMLLEKARPAKDVFKYLVLYIAEKYLQTNIMSYDAIYVHMIEKYYTSGDAFWASPSDIDFEAKRAAVWKKLLIGEVAPELILKNEAGEWHSLYQVPNKYTLLVFWAPSCGHCATIIPPLYNFYKEYKDIYDIGTFAINTDIGPEEVEAWKKYIKEKGLDWDNYNGGEANVDWHEVYDIISTPVIYLLDQDKKIVGKKLNAVVLEKLFEVLEPEKSKIAKEQKAAKATETETENNNK
jgi:thiol-disulfide isomerase/thioredoxin